MDSLTAITESLQAMGFADSYISRAISVHEKSKRGTNYDIAWLIEIISRLKSKDKSKQYYNDDQVQPFRSCFSSMNEVLSSLNLRKGKAVDYRYENGRFLLCEVQSVRTNNHQHTILSLHPMGVSVSNTKHDRICNLFHEYHRIRAPKSVSLRTVSPKDVVLYSLQIDAYVDVNPIHRKGTCIVHIFSYLSVYETPSNYGHILWQSTKYIQECNMYQYASNNICDILRS